MSPDDQAMLNRPPAENAESVPPGSPRAEGGRPGPARRLARAFARGAALCAAAGVLLWYFGVAPGTAGAAAGAFLVAMTVALDVRKWVLDVRKWRSGRAGPRERDSGEAGRAALLAMTERRYELSGMPVATLTMVIFMAVLARAGDLVRCHFIVPGAWEVAAVSALLAGWAVRTGLRKRRAGRAEPAWAAAARARQEQDMARLPDGPRQAVQAALGRVADGAGLEVFLYVARCTQHGAVHYGLCHAGASVPQRGRGVFMIGEHLLEGDAAAALAVIAHEQGHFAGWRYWSVALVATAGTYGALVAGWALPWPQALIALIGLRLLATAVSWIVEIGCDVVGARATGAEAQAAMLRYKKAARDAGRAAQPASKRAAAVLAAATGTVHPPEALRCLLVRALAA